MGTTVRSLRYSHAYSRLGALAATAQHRCCCNGRTTVNVAVAGETDLNIGARETLLKYSLKTAFSFV